MPEHRKQKKPKQLIQTLGFIGTWGHGGDVATAQRSLTVLLTPGACMLASSLSERSLSLGVPRSCDVGWASSLGGAHW
jgi:hypothetical protein